MVNILVVEDDKHTRKLLETILKREGYGVLKAEDGVVAMEVLDNHHIVMSLQKSLEMQIV